MLARAEIDALFPADLPGPEHWESRFPPRDLPAGAQVTRFSPSPTGFLHIGGVYTAMISKAIAAQSGGPYLLRVEDTDQSREVEGALEQFARAFAYFSIEPTEFDGHGGYGPYTQSHRAEIYLTYVRELMRAGHAYPCFATRDELAAVTARQQAAKVPTGYYGSWAIWRDASDEDVRQALADGRPYVVRFRSPGRPGQRVRYTDLIRGPIEADENVNDVVILKSSDQPRPLPTYHFAHAVDDHLMRISVVIRAEEWIPSVPVHLQLFAALGFDQVPYAHIAPLLKNEGGGKRKLSKRKDPEASVDYYIGEGYPADAVMYYLRGLANGRLAELPLREALDATISLSDCGVAGPLLDLVKLDDISADYVAALPNTRILAEVREWAGRFDPELLAAIDSEPDVVLAALDVERAGVANPRKDLRRWGQFREVYGYFLDPLYATPTLDGPLAALDPAVARAVLDDFVASYQHVNDPDGWFQQIRDLTARHGFAANQKEQKADPGRYHGSIREVSQLIRVALTGSTRSPDLFQVAMVLGDKRVVARVTDLRASLSTPAA
jgi:glutamyl-tRNA synthetase